MDSEGFTAKADVGMGLRLIDISKSFGKTRVLDDFSLEVHQGELCCLLGPSGCGKTTALKIIDGLLEPDSGQVLIGDRDITQMPTQKRDLGMVFQNYALFPQMDVYENVAYGLRRRRVAENQLASRVHEALETVRLADYGRRRVHELSGGQQQRVALARALVIKPEALLLDEPLSNLDARLRTDMRQEIRRIQKEMEITTVYVTHDQEEAMSIADRIVVMNQGRMEQIGLPREVYENPETRFVADFIGRINFIPVERNSRSFCLFGKSYALPDGLSGTGHADIIGAVRPERIRLTREHAAVPAAVVREVLFIGASVRYRLQAGSGNQAPEIEAEAYVPREVFETGQKVGLVIEPEDIKLFLA